MPAHTTCFFYGGFTRNGLAFTQGSINSKMRIWGLFHQFSRGLKGGGGGKQHTLELGPWKRGGGFMLKK